MTFDYPLWFVASAKDGKARQSLRFDDPNIGFLRAKDDGNSVFFFFTSKERAVAVARWFGIPEKAAMFPRVEDVGQFVRLLFLLEDRKYIFVDFDYDPAQGDLHRQIPLVLLRQHILAAATGNA